MLGVLGYKVMAIDIDPEPYMGVAKRFDIRVIRCDLERERIDVPMS